MGYLIGTDEAGYGPNLGPLVIAGTVWQVPDGHDGRDLYRLLRGVVQAEPGTGSSGRRIAIGDSKTLYRSGGGLGALERGVWSCLPRAPLPESWRAAWSTLAPQALAAMGRAPWFDGYDEPCPCEATLEQLAELNASLHPRLERRGVRVVALAAVAVFPDELNDLVEKLGNKATALTHVTLGLLQTLLEPLDGQPVLASCDKHGGRNRYGPQLQQQFPEYLVEVLRESRDESRYAWGPAARRIEARFVARGECYLPAALASMTAKYLRELALRAFNSYWCSRVPQLRPTAGYPGDAQRFRKMIAAEQQRLGIDDHILWRNR